MKKLILTSAALMAFAAATYAQTFQQGQQQQATINQGSTNQAAIINQLQNPTDANFNNYGNYAISYQNMGSNNGPNSLTINQNAGSQGNRAGVGQDFGQGNVAYLSQSGGVDGLSGGATSTSATANSRGEDGNFAGIAQIGNFNSTSLTQDNNSRRNSAEAYTNGNNNSVLINQSNNSIGNTAFVYQGYNSQNAQTSTVSSASAVINQGKVLRTDASTGGTISESIQNTASISQLSSNVIATINQGSRGSIPGLSTTSSGRSYSSTASITQGSVGGPTADFNTAVINQGVNSADVTGSLATITQSSPRNSAFITQGYDATGSDNQSVATITQNGTSSGGAGSTNGIASIFQGLAGATDRSQATILQTGNVTNSYAQIVQGNGQSGTGGSYSSQDIASITQSGNNTTAFITQSGVRVGTAGTEGNGRNNSATIVQQAGVTGTGVPTSFGNGIIAPTAGATGIAIIEQGVSSAAGAGNTQQASRNVASINQVTGNGLRARIGQGTQAAAGGAVDGSGAPLALTALAAGAGGTTPGAAFALVGTVSNDNSATITQGQGNGHNANIFQNGRFNSGVINQSGGTNSAALIVQSSASQYGRAVINQTSTGNNNSATILQFAGTNAYNTSGFGNTATINQIGSGSNNIAVAQQGTPAGTSPTAGGSGISSNNNLATITQNGSNNRAVFLQVGDKNSVDIYQLGVGNDIRSQLAGGVAGGPNTFGSQQGYNNRLTVRQNSSGASATGFVATYTQIGNNLTSTINQGPAIP